MQETKPIATNDQMDAFKLLESKPEQAQATGKVTVNSVSNYDKLELDQKMFAAGEGPRDIKSDVFKIATQQKKKKYEKTSKNIAKTKGYKKVSTLNALTGRQNQALQCLLCGITFIKLCNVLDHVRTHVD